MSDKETSSREGVNMVFSETNVTIMLWFVVIFLMLSSFMNLFRDNEFSFTIKLLDFVFLLVLVSATFNDFYSLDKESRQEPLFSAFSRFKTFLTDYSSIFTLLMVHLVLFLIFRGFQLNSSNLPSTINFVYLIATLALILLIIVIFIQDILGVPVIDDLYSAVGKLFEEVKDEEEEEEKKEEVFNVSNNLYTYEEAPYVCQALGGRLASYDEIEEAYNKGGEWCNYGWSQDQMAYFPTQKETWNLLQSNEDYKNACGRPGINGGYIDNPRVKFGVNCFGIKPDPSSHEQSVMDANKESVFPKSRSQTEIDKKVKFWKENADKLLTINSYNKDNWSRY